MGKRKAEVYRDGEEGGRGIQGWGRGRQRYTGMGKREAEAYRNGKRKAEVYRDGEEEGRGIQGWGRGRQRCIGMGKREAEVYRNGEEEDSGVQERNFQLGSQLIQCTQS